MSDWRSAQLADAMNKHLKAEHAQFEEQQQALIREAYALFDKLQKSQSDAMRERHITRLYRMGFIVRPMHMVIASDTPGQSEELNAGSTQWGLYNRTTMRPVTRPTQQSKEAGK